MALALADALPQTATPVTPSFAPPALTSSSTSSPATPSPSAPPAAPPAQPPAPVQLSMEDFGQRIKAKHPEYADMDNRTLAQKVITKYPQYQDMVKPDAPPQSFLQNLQSRADATVGSGPQSVVPVTDPVGTFKGTMERLRQGLAQGAESVVVHPLQTAHSSVELPIDVMRATGTSPEFIGQHLSDPEVQKQIQAARDRLAAQWDAAKKNPAGTIGQLIGGGLVTHGLSEVTGAAGSAVLGGAKSAVVGTGEALSGAGDLGVGAVKDLRKAGEGAIAEQTTAEESNAAAQAKYAQDVEEAQEDAGTKNDTAQKQMLRQYVKNQQVADQRNSLSQANYEAQTEADKLNHANKVAQITAQNEAAEQAAAEQTAANSAAAKQKYAENVQAAQDTESERGDLARQEIQTRLRLMRRAQTVAKQARSSVDAQYGQVRTGIADAIKTGDAVQPPWETLTDTVEQAKDLLQGSQQKIPVFESILKRANEVGDLESQRQAVMESRNFPEGSYSTLSPEHKALVDEAIENNDLLRRSGAVPIPEENGTPTAPYGHLSGYSSEIGRELRDNPGMDGDIKRALTKVKAHLDAMKQVMADQAGEGARLKSANKNWAIYKDVFHENTGPSGSGSPVAKALKAEDATNATEPFLSKDSEIASRARQMLVGQPNRGPGSYFDPGAGYLVDKLRDIRSRVDALPKKPAEVPPYQEPAPVNPKLKPVPDESAIPVRAVPKQAQPAPVVPREPTQPAEVAPPKLKPDAEPLNIRQIKLEAYQRAADNLKYLNKWQIRGLLGIAGGLIGHALGQGSEASLLEGAAAAFGPMALGRLIDTDTFKNWVGAPRPRDFELLGKLKGSDKIKVQDDITGQIVSLAQAGQRVKVSPQIQGFVGPENIIKIAKAITKTKGAVSGMTGAEKIKAGMKAGVAAGGGAGAVAQSQQQQSQQPQAVPKSTNSETMVEPNPKGLVEPGNLPIWNRPTVQNADGSHSSEYSTSFQDDKGREVLVPTIVNGKFLTPDGKKPPEGSAAERTMFHAAWQHYLRTGENLGKFSNAADADVYAGKLHNRGARP
jgi:hypothetical protein